MRRALVILALVIGTARAAHSQSYTLTTSWPVDGNLLVSDGASLYVLNSTSGLVTHFDLSGATTGSFSVAPDPDHARSTNLAGFDPTGNVYVAHFDNVSGSLDLYAPNGASVAPRRALAWPVEAVDHEGLMYAIGRDDYGDRQLITISAAGDEIGASTIGHPYAFILGVSWDDRLCLSNEESAGCPRYQVWVANGPGVTGRDCGQGEPTDYIPMFGTSDGQGGSFVLARRGLGNYSYAYSVDRYGSGVNARLARFDLPQGGEMIASDSQGAVYVLVQGAVQKWVPSAVTPTVRSTWGSLKARWR